MAEVFENAALRQVKTNRDLALYLRQNSAKIRNESIKDHLLASIESEALPPDVYAYYLAAVDSPAALGAALRQPFSRSVRLSAIKQFGKAMKTPRWEAMWNEVGGTVGLLSLLSELSVVEVGWLCKVIGFSAQWPASKSTLKQHRVTELLQGLLPERFPVCTHQTHDDRPLRRHYARLIPACTSDFIRDMILNDGEPFEWDQWQIRRIAQSHWPMLRKLVIHALRSEKSSHQPGTAAGSAARSLMRLYVPYLLNEIPQIKGHEKGFSASMTFSLEILRAIAHKAESYFEEHCFESTLVMPLLRRAVLGKAKMGAIREIIDLALTYLQGHPNIRMGSYISNDNSFSALIVKVWTVQPRLLEDQLVAALRCQSFGQPRTFPAVDDILGIAKKEHRYDLLRLVILHAQGLKADIDKDYELRKVPIKQWPTCVFFKLPGEKARTLLQRLIELKPEGDFLQLPADSGPSTILSQPPSPGMGYADPKLLLILLNSKRPDVKEDARKATQHHQEKSFRSRGQVERAFYARSAAFHAIASGSLDLFNKIVLWLRRYLRDPLSVKTIYSRDTINTKEGIALLSGIPEDLSQFDVRHVSGLVMKGNVILMDVFETAVLALSEPSFSMRDWNGPKLLFQDVVAARIRHSRRLKNALNLTDDTVYETLWASTLDLLLKVENIGLQTEREPLGFNAPRGPLFPQDVWVGLPAQSAFDPAAYRFIDELARARDNLWTQYRPTLHPACASLSKHWPPGLSIQALTGEMLYRVDNDAAEPHTPFISSRAHAIVFMDGNPIQNEKEFDDEMRAAVGEFVDSYETALQIYVLQHKPDRRREDRASAVLAHAINLCCCEMSSGEDKKRMSEDEALRLCRPAFDRALPDVKITAFRKLDENEKTGYPVLPHIPTVFEPQERFEWDPMATKSHKAKARQVPASLLDFMLAAPPNVSYRTLRIPEVFVLSGEHAGIWSPEKLCKIRWEKRAVQEGTLASALLFQESKVGGKSNILTSAFPSVQDVRYPPLFLDQNFLESAKDEEVMAHQAIFTLRCKAPSTLIRTLADNAISALSDEKLNPTEGSALERTTYGLLGLLSQSDRPELACDRVLRTIIDRPDSSSWHRQLLTKNFLRRLSRSQAQHFIRSFEASIHSKLDEQTRLRESRQKLAQDQSQTIPSSTAKPIIKVTTIKFLAQFLDDQDAVPPKASVQMLFGLLQKSSHVDVRVAVVESLLSKLSSCESKSTDELEEQIFQSFERLIPVMGSLNERHQLNEEGWQQAKHTGNLPDVYDDGGSIAIAPILRTMCSAVESAQLSNEQCKKLLNRVILPALIESQANNARWVSMFIEKYCPGSQDHTLTPSLPVQPSVLARLLNANLSEMPLWILNLHQHYCLINIEPPLWLTDLNKRISNDAETRSSNAGRRWLYFYGRGAGAIFSSTVSLAGFLQEGRFRARVSAGEGIEIEHIQQCLLEQASSLLRLSDPDFTNWDGFISELFPPLQANADDKRAAWLAHGKPVLEQILASVDSIRASEDWQRDPHRTGHASFLPPTFPLRVQLLEYPQLTFASDRYKRFGTQLLQLLREVQGLGLAHHHKLEDIADAALRADDNVCLAAWIGDVDSHLDKARSSAQNTEELILRVELAEKLLDEKLSDNNGSLLEEEKEPIAKLVRLWSRSGIEEIRMWGFRMGKRMEDWIRELG